MRKTRKSLQLILASEVNESNARRQATRPTSASPDADSGGEEADNNDTTRLEAALAVGAHSISTDYPGQVEGIDYWVEIPNGTPSRCNPISAPAWCSSEDIESLG